MKRRSQKVQNPLRLRLPRGPGTRALAAGPKLGPRQGHRRRASSRARPRRCVPISLPLAPTRKAGASSSQPVFGAMHFKKVKIRQSRGVLGSWELPLCILMRCDCQRGSGFFRPLSYILRLAAGRPNTLICIHSNKLTASHVCCFPHASALPVQGTDAHARTTIVTYNRRSRDDSYFASENTKSWHTSWTK